MEKEAKTLEYGYETKDIILDKNGILLIDLINQRQIRESQVSNIIRALRQGKHFDVPFIVNVNNGTKRIRVIDGGHRTVALKKYFDMFPENKVKVNMIIYRDLTDTQEREIYTKWNVGVKQSIDDFINSYRVEIPEYETIISELPVSAYGSKNKMKIRTVLNAYFSTKQKIFRGTDFHRGTDFVESCKKIDQSDIETIKDTFEMMVDIFNPTGIVDFTRLPAFKITIFTALFHLIHDNKIMLGRNYIIKRMKTVFNSKSVLETFSRISGSRQACVEVYLQCKKLLNDGVEHQFK
jgi:hypothetical protein